MRRYLGRDHDGAHAADADTEVLPDLLSAMLQEHGLTLREAVALSRPDHATRLTGPDDSDSGRMGSSCSPSGRTGGSRWRSTRTTSTGCSGRTFPGRRRRRSTGSRTQNFDSRRRKLLDTRGAVRGIYFTKRLLIGPPP